MDDFISEENGVLTGEHTAYLHLNVTDLDTIKTEWEYEENEYFKIKRLWYNGEEFDPDHTFIIRK